MIILGGEWSIKMPWFELALIRSQSKRNAYMEVYPMLCEKNDSIIKQN